MSAPLKILMLEDSDTDAEIIQRLLKREGMDCEFQVAMTKDSFLHNLKKYCPDLILADNSLPQFNATEALKIIREDSYNIPFIMVTGTVSEEFAANIIKSGADDFILKDRLMRLPAAINAALKQRQTDKENMEAQQKLLKSHKEVLEVNKQLRELSSHLENIREEERIQIARDIHDELGQQLTGLKMDVYWLKERATSDNPEIKQKITSMIGLIDETVKSVRRIASHLRPSILDDLGLIAALEWHSEEVVKRSGIHIEFNSSLQDITIPVTIATALFRIYQEVLTNAVRHSNATKIESSLNWEDDDLIMEISDNGVGMDLVATKAKKTLGLIGIKERTFALGGKYDLQSSPGKGTKTKIYVPFKVAITP